MRKSTVCRSTSISVKTCHHRFEVIQRLSDPAEGECEECGGVAKRQISAPAFQFKGTGWYVTDYADRKSSESSSSGSESKVAEAKKGRIEGHENRDQRESEHFGLE